MQFFSEHLLFFCIRNDIAQLDTVLERETSMKWVLTEKRKKDKSSPVYKINDYHRIELHIKSWKPGKMESGFIMLQYTSRTVTFPSSFSKMLLQLVVVLNELSDQFSMAVYVLRYKDLTRWRYCLISDHFIVSERFPGVNSMSFHVKYPWPEEPCFLVQWSDYTVCTYTPSSLKTINILSSVQWGFFKNHKGH